jgi:hypothetical protein
VSRPNVAWKGLTSYASYCIHNEPADAHHTTPINGETDQRPSSSSAFFVGGYSSCGQVARSEVGGRPHFDNLALSESGWVCAVTRIGASTPEFLYFQSWLRGNGANLCHKLARQ